MSIGVKLSRRNFMKTVAAMGATAFLSKYGTDIAKAVAEVKDYWHICWLNGAACTGCTVSFAQIAEPDLIQVLTEITVGTSGLPIALPDYMETIHPASGTLAESLKERWAAGSQGKRIMVVEGSIQNAGYCVIAGKDFREHVKEAAEIADVIVAVGQCATYGGIPAAKPNPTGAKGLKDYLTEVGISKPVVNLPMCPVNGEHVILTLAAVILGAPLNLDEYGRPKAFFGTNMHDELCPYRPYYDRGIFITVPGEEEGCRYKIGCKGPITHTDCPSRKWVNHTSYCVEVGAPCIGCSEPGWPDRFSPFYKEIPELPTLLRTDATTLGQGLLAATAAGIVIHGVRRAVTGGKKEEKEKEV
ncbi:MAG TPA: twin-arginine translocation signal domain-containing protein [Archaeoglobaceae archaeon]|nr:twin-arginine translocation signal domain-containing protein [Archaeoglobaceae archaeon]